MQLMSYFKYGLAVFAIALTGCGGGGSSDKSASSAMTVTSSSTAIVASSTATSSSSIAVSSASSSVALIEDVSLVLPSSLEVVTNEAAH